MDVRAAVAWKAGAPLTIETVQLDGPKGCPICIWPSLTPRYCTIF